MKDQPKIVSIFKNVKDKIKDNKQEELDKNPPEKSGVFKIKDLELGK